VPHAVYLAVWSASAVLILLGGAHLRVGALLGVGTSIVTFGPFFTDAGTAIAGGAHVMGTGLVLALAGWLACCRVRDGFPAATDRRTGHGRGAASGRWRLPQSLRSARQSRSPHRGTATR
jgi:hypothetical protein